MEFKNEPQVKQEWQLKQIVIVSSAIVGIIALAFFLFNNLYPSSDAVASGKGGDYYELNGSIGDDAVSKIFDNVKDGDTLAITEKFVISKEFKDLYDKNIVLLVNGYLVWTIEYPMYLGKEAKVVFGDKGEIVTEDKTCTGKTSFQFGGKSLASCDGKDASYSFEEVVKSGGVDINGLLSKVQTFNITGTTADKENIEVFKAAQNGDTIKISGKFLISDNFKDLVDKDVIIVVEEGWLIWEKAYSVYLSKDSKVLMGENGGLYSGNCDGDMMLYFDNAEMASCNGKNAKYSFDEVNKEGGISYEGLTALPVELIQFDVMWNNNQVNILWATASEINNKHFEIEKSTNNIDWLVIGKVAGKGNTQSISRYTFSDINPSTDVSYYRLKQTDFDGKYEYSYVRSLDKNKVAANQTSIYPNPAQNFVNVKVATESNYKVTIATNMGDVKLSQNMTTSLETIDLTSFANGIYYVSIQYGAVNETHKLTIKH